MTVVAAVIVAGGTGERFGRAGGKQLLEVGERPMVSWALSAFDSAPSTTAIVLVTPPDRVDEYRRVAVDPLGLLTEVVVVPGGERRQDSVAAGLEFVSDDAELVAIHDGARPLLTAETIEAAVRVLLDDPSLDGVVVGHPATDTLKVVEGRIIVDTVDRQRYWHAQTPQIFRTGAFRTVVRRAQAEGWEATDDAALIERAGGRVAALEGPRDNLKVTLPEDAAIVEAVLRWREGKGS